MGRTDSPPISSTATETIADIANYCLTMSHPDQSHSLDDLAHKIIPTSVINQRKRDPTSFALSAPTLRDPSLPNTSELLTYVDVFVDVFVDDFLALVQGVKKKRRVRRILMESVDDIFRPLQNSDNKFRTEPISIKKLLKGDCSWSTCKTILGWVINTVAGTIELPPHRVERLGEILSSIPRSQKRISEKKRHKVLGELISMSIALPGSRNLFSVMQQA